MRSVTYVLSGMILAPSVLRIAHTFLNGNVKPLPLFHVH